MNQIQEDQYNNAPLEFFGVIILNALIIVATLIIFKIIWIPIGVSLPYNQFNDDDDDQIRFTSLYEVLSYHTNLIWKFDMKYWIGTCGLEAYLFLYVQRCFLLLTGTLFLISFATLFTIKDITTMTIFILDEKFSQGYQLLMTTIFTILLMWLTNTMIHYIDNTIKINIDTKQLWMISHTLHVKGLPPEIQQDQLRLYIEKYLTTLMNQQNQFGIGKILAAHVIPNCSSWVKLEAQRRVYKSYQKFLQYYHIPFIMKYFIPSKYIQQEYYLNKLKEIIEKQKQELAIENHSSSHAFFIVDSDEALEHLIAKYSLSRAHINCFKQTCHKIVQCFNITGSNDDESEEEQQKIGLKSTNLQVPTAEPIFPDNLIDSLELGIEKGISIQSPMVQSGNSMVSSLIKHEPNTVLTVLVKSAAMPEDILYFNLENSMKRDLILRVMFLVAAFFLLFFCTSPASIYQLMGLQLNSASVGNSIIVQYTSIVLVNILNCIILFLIELSVDQQKPSCRWYYQKGVYSRCVFYLTMNMLIIPALSFAAFTNIYQVFREDGTNLLPLFKAVYFLNNGKFFASLILSSASAAFFTYMLRLSDLFFAWGSPEFAEFQRMKIQNQPIHLLKPGDEYPYGYFYALQIAVLYIVMTFGTNVMAIHFSGMLYYLIRLYLDSFIIHWVYKKDMNSQSKLSQNVVLSAVMSVIPLQIIILSIFLYNRDNLYIFFSLILLGITCLFHIRLQTKRTTFQQKLEMKVSQNCSKRLITKNDLNEWKHQYSYPMDFIYPDEY